MNPPPGKYRERKLVTNLDEIEDTLIRRNIYHLSEPEGTRLTTKKIEDIISRDRCATCANQSLSCNFTLPDNLLSPLQTNYFKNLK